MRGLGESTYYTRFLKQDLDNVAQGNDYNIEHEVGKRRLRIMTDADANVIENLTNVAKQKMPKSNELSMELSNGLPLSYTKVDYLECYENDVWIQTGLISNKLNIDVTASHFVGIGGDGNVVCGSDRNGIRYKICGNTLTSCGWVFQDEGVTQWGQLSSLTAGDIWNLKVDFQTLSVYMTSGTKSRTQTFNERYLDLSSNLYFVLFGYGTENKNTASHGTGTKQVRIYSFSANREGINQMANFIPVLNNTGTPCMFDLVTRRPFYNSGPGDFLYPTPSTTYSLRRYTPEYAIKTPTGIRKLYHVPENYDGSIEDYVKENNYKRLVEPECPNEEGKFYESKWNETDEELILEWIEVEPPVLEDEQLLTEEL